jgi:hypothetical protein
VDPASSIKSALAVDYNNGTYSGASEATLATLMIQANMILANMIQANKIQAKDRWGTNRRVWPPGWWASAYTPHCMMALKSDFSVQVAGVGATGEPGVSSPIVAGLYRRKVGFTMVARGQVDNQRTTGGVGFNITVDQLLLPPSGVRSPTNATSLAVKDNFGPYSMSRWVSKASNNSVTVSLSGQLINRGSSLAVSIIPAMTWAEQAHASPPLTADGKLEAGFDYVFTIHLRGGYEHAITCLPYDPLRPQLGVNWDVFNDSTEMSRNNVSLSVYREFLPGVYSPVGPKKLPAWRCGSGQCTCRQTAIVPTASRIALRPAADVVGFSFDGPCSFTKETNLVSPVSAVTLGEGAPDSWGLSFIVAAQQMAAVSVRVIYSSMQASAMRTAKTLYNVKLKSLSAGQYDAAVFLNGQAMGSASAIASSSKSPFVVTMNAGAVHGPATVKGLQLSVAEGTLQALSVESRDAWGNLRSQRTQHFVQPALSEKSLTAGSVTGGVYLVTHQSPTSVGSFGLSVLFAFQAVPQAAVKGSPHSPIRYESLLFRPAPNKVLQRLTTSTSPTDAMVDFNSLESPVNSGNCSTFLSASTKVLKQMEATQVKAHSPQHSSHGGHTRVMWCVVAKHTAYSTHPGAV